MKKGNFITINALMDRLLMDPLMEGINLETVVRYLTDFLEIIERPATFIDKVSVGNKFTDYRFELPPDFFELTQLTIDNMPGRFNPDTYSMFIKELNAKEENKGYFDTKDVNANSTYRISGNYIYFPRETGYVDLAYNAIATDLDIESPTYGLPLVPDDSVFLEAIKSYIEVQWFRTLWRAGKIPQQVFTEAQQTYSWNVGRYDTHSKRMDLGERESLSKQFKDIYNRHNNFYSRYKFLGTK